MNKTNNKFGYIGRESRLLAMPKAGHVVQLPVYMIGSRAESNIRRETRPMAKM